MFAPAELDWTLGSVADNPATTIPILLLVSEVLHASSLHGLVAKPLIRSLRALFAQPGLQPHLVGPSKPSSSFYFREPTASIGLLVVLQVTVCQDGENEEVERVANLFGVHLISLAAVERSSSKATFGPRLLEVAHLSRCLSSVWHVHSRQQHVLVTNSAAQLRANALQSFSQILRDVIRQNEDFATLDATRKQSSATTSSAFANARRAQEFDGSTFVLSKRVWQATSKSWPLGTLGGALGPFFKSYAEKNALPLLCSVESLLIDSGESKPS
eukprot:m.198433 g.198433  ORF g.198433 m.198433 type:complete len:272 (-) comp53788_c0_seq18:7-822(-)